MLTRTVNLNQDGAPTRHYRNRNYFLRDRSLSLGRRRNRTSRPRHNRAIHARPLHVWTRTSRPANRIPRRRRMGPGRLGTFSTPQLGPLDSRSIARAGNRGQHSDSIRSCNRPKLASGLVWRSNDGESNNGVVSASSPRRDRSLQTKIATDSHRSKQMKNQLKVYP